MHSLSVRMIAALTYLLLSWKRAQVPYDTLVMRERKKKISFK